MIKCVIWMNLVSASYLGLRIVYWLLCNMSIPASVSSWTNNPFAHTQCSNSLVDSLYSNSWLQAQQWLTIRAPMNTTFQMGQPQAQQCPAWRYARHKLCPHSWIPPQGRMGEGVIWPARQWSGEWHNFITISKQCVGPNTRLILNTFKSHILSWIFDVL